MHPPCRYASDRRIDEVRFDLPGYMRAQEKAPEIRGFIRHLAENKYFRLLIALQPPHKRINCTKALRHPVVVNLDRIPMN